MLQCSAAVTCVKDHQHKQNFDYNLFLCSGSHPALSVSAGASEKTVQQAQGTVEMVWAGAMQPLVMGLAGASIYFPSLSSGTALRALALTAIGEHAVKVDCQLYLSVLMCSIAASWA